MPNGPQDKEAIVLSGGGAFGAFEVGVMRALYDGRSPVTGYRPLVPEILTGTSVGAYNATFLAALGRLPGPAAMARLQDVWLDRIADSPTTCGSQVYRLRTAPFEPDPACWAQPFRLFSQGVADAAHWAEYAVTRGAAFFQSEEQLPVRLLESINLASLISPEPLYRLIDETISRQQLRASPTQVAIAATNWLTGQLRLFDKQTLEMADGLRAVAASAAIPAVFPPVEVGGALFVDGGVLENTPIKPAIRFGADVLHVIFVDPAVCDIPMPSVPNTYSTVQRAFAIIRAAAINRDVGYATGIDEELRSLRRKGLLSRDLRSAAPHAPEDARTIRRLREGRKPAFRRLTIHRYRPQVGLGTTGGFIDFRRAAIEELIEIGYANAVEHDCEREGCLLAGEPITQAKGEDHA